MNATNLDRDAMPSVQIERNCSMRSAGSVRLSDRPLGGAHHRIGTGHTIINMVFRHLQAECATRGGTLTNAELADGRPIYLTTLNAAWTCSKTFIRHV